EAPDVHIHRIDGDTFRLVASVGAFAGTYPADISFRITRGSAVGRAVLDRRTIHLHDTAAESDEEFPVSKDLARRYGQRTILATPLLREGTAIGAVVMLRREARSFSDKQVTLVRTFADQAVIAIENVRLFNETKETLEQRVATSEVLAVISRSPTDVQPVFETIAALARRLCNARECAVFRFDGELIHLVAHAAVGAAWANALRSAFPRPPGRGSITARAILTHSLVHVPDALADPEYDLTEAARASGVRTALSIPMIREGQVIGAITVDRGE